MNLGDLISLLKEKKNHSKKIVSAQELNLSIIENIEKQLDNLSDYTVIGAKQFIESSDLEEKTKNDISTFLKKGPYSSSIQQSRSFITNSIKKYSEAYEELYNNEKTMKRLSTTESFKALSFRIATTLGVGLSIMFIYWLAYKLEIPMPLLRLPT